MWKGVIYPNYLSVYNLIFGITIFHLSIFSHGQGPFSWPSDLQIDPNEYLLTKLGVTEITQFKTYREGKYIDSSNQTYLDFIITYDTNNRVASFKYDFQNHIGYSKYFGDSTALDSLRNIAIEKKLPLHFVKLNNRWVAQSYWEVIFFYNNHGLFKMEVLNPHQRLGYPGVLDGVYVRKGSPEKILITNYYNEFGEIVQTDGRSEDTLLWQKLYKYETYNINGIEARLMTESNIDGTVFTIEYKFKD